MNSRLARLAALLVACSGAIVFAVLLAPLGAARSSGLSPQQIADLHQLSTQIARANGGNGPQSIDVVATTRSAANAIDSGAVVNSDQDVFMVVMRGTFEEHVAPPPAGDPIPRGSVLAFTYDPVTDQVLDLSVGATAPPLDQLGTVTSITP